MKTSRFINNRTSKPDVNNYKVANAEERRARLAFKQEESQQNKRVNPFYQFNKLEIKDEVTDILPNDTPFNKVRNQIVKSYINDPYITKEDIYFFEKMITNSANEAIRTQEKIQYENQLEVPQQRDAVKEEIEGIVIDPPSCEGCE